MKATIYNAPTQEAARRPWTTLQGNGRTSISYANKKLKGTTGRNYNRILRVSLEIRKIYLYQTNPL